MTIHDITLGAKLVFRWNQFSRARAVTVVDIVSGFIKVKPSRGKPITCGPQHLSLPEPPPDPTELAPGEQRLFNIISAMGPLPFDQVAEIANGDPEKGKLWTASTVASLARRPRMKRLVKSEGGRVALI